MRRAVRIPTAAKGQKGEPLCEEEKMKILGIDRARSKSGEIVLIIDPQLTPEVFEKFRELWNADDFSISSGCHFGRSICGFDLTESRKGERPSDHTPVVAEFEILPFRNARRQ